MVMANSNRMGANRVIEPSDGMVDETTPHVNMDLSEFKAHRAKNDLSNQDQ